VQVCPSCLVFSGPDAESTQSNEGISSTAAQSDENSVSADGADAVQGYYDLTPEQARRTSTGHASPEINGTLNAFKLDKENQQKEL